jgi:lysyl-tRNA synthetase class 2
MTKDVLINERLKKIKLWKELGFEAYTEKFDRNFTSQLAKEFCNNKKNKIREITEIFKSPSVSSRLCGRIVNLREMGKLAFLRIKDGEGDFQICLAREILGEKQKQFCKALDLGDFCGFEGEFFITKHGEPTLLATSVFPLSKTIRPLPEKFHGVTDQEKCYRERNLDLISNPETFNRFKIRSAIVREIRNFFHEKGFDEIETRILQNQAGGAMAKTFDTHHNALDSEMVMRIALELDLKIAVSGGLERVFEIGKCFRNEGIDPSHLQEFTMIEWYAAYADLETNKKWTSELIQTVLKKSLGTMKVIVLDKEEKEIEIDFGKEFKEERFPDLLKNHAKLDMFTASDEDVRKKAKEVGVEKIEGVSRANLLDDIYKKTARPKLIQPTFVFDYPEDLKPLARPKGDGTADCFQLLIAGWEVINSYGELINPIIQRQLLEKQSSARIAGDEEAMEVDEEFLRAMEHGFPPMTGSGIGIDRFVALITTQPNLRDVVLFPMMKEENIKTVSKSKETKIAVVILNNEAKLKPWQKMNAVGHLSAAFAARAGEHLFLQDKIETKDKKKINFNIQHAIMIKSADSNAEISELVTLVKEDNNLEVSEFTREMLEVTDDRKVVEQTKVKNFKDVEYIGVLFFGKKSLVDKLTKDFPLEK